MTGASSPGRRSYCGPAVFSLSLLLLLTAAPVNSQSSTIDCSETGRVVREPDGNLSYGSLPPTDPPDTEEYSPRGLEGWYNLARGFVNTVQPENLPYDVIEESIRENEQGCPTDAPTTGPGDSQVEQGATCETDAQTTLQEFGEWWAPLIVVTVLGGIMAFIFGLVGAIFWCCRCCGQCGGSRSMQDPQDKCMFGITIALFLVTLLLFVGVVLSFYSNEQSFDTIASFQQTMNDIVGTAVGYMDAFLNDGDGILCQFIQVTDIALDETSVLNNSLNELVDEVAGDVDNVLQRLSGLSEGINQTSDILMNVSTTSQDLRTAGNTLTTTLDSISSRVETLQAACGGVVSQCSDIPDPSTFQAGANYSNLPDVSQELNDVQESLDGINIQNSIEEGNAEFESVSGEILSQVNTHLGGRDDDSSNSSSVLQSLTEANDTLFDTRDDVVGDIRKVIRNDFNIEDCPEVDQLLNGEANNITVDVGFIRECYINQFFERLQEYDEYRYGFGIIVCCLALLTVALTLLGVILGVVGWRKDRSPDSRTRLSHCGGIILLVDVGLTFLFGFVLLILASLAFFFGSNLQKICQAIEPPEYEVFSRVVDNRELWGRSVLGDALLGSGQNLSLSGALRACEADEALYTAFNLSVLFDVRTEILNTSEIFDELNEQVTDTINSFNYTSDSFLDNQTRSALNGFTSASVDSINITAFRETLSADVLGFNILETITTLTDLSTAFTSVGRADLASQTDDIINNLTDIRDNQLPAIENNVALLETQVDQLSTHIDSVVVQTDLVVADIDGLVVNLTGENFRGRIQGIAIGTLDNLEGYIGSFVNFTTVAIETEVGRCRPLATIYSSAHSVVCNEAVDGLNGYWWSLGFCSVCFIPLIVLAVIASAHYLRQKPGYDDSSYPDIPLKPR